jgi:hypothetical protein
MGMLICVPFEYELLREEGKAMLYLAGPGSHVEMSLFCNVLENN